MKKIYYLALPLLALLSVSCEDNGAPDEITGIGILTEYEGDYRDYYYQSTSEHHEAVGNLSNFYDIYCWYYPESAPAGTQSTKDPSNAWSVSCDADWCHYEYEETANDYGRKYLSLSYELDNNDTGEERSTTIKVQNGDATCEINITQNGYSVVNVTTPGTLVDKLAEQNLLYASTLKITGELNEADLNTIKGLKKVILLDLSEIIIDDLPDRMFNYNNTIKTISLPKSITTIHSETFSNSSIETVIIPTNIERIEDGEYYGLNNSSLPASGNGAFSSSNLSKIIFEPNSKLKYIGDAAFIGCVNLTEITIPSSVEIIGDYAFSYEKGYDDRYQTPEKLFIDFEENSQLKSLGGIYIIATAMHCEIDASNCSQIESINGDIFTHIHKFKIGTTTPPTANTYILFGGETLEVPKGCVGAYYQANGWKKFEEIIEFE